MKKHFITFMTPLGEWQSQMVKSWDVKNGVRMSQRVKSTYGFYYTTEKTTTGKGFRIKETSQSGRHFLSGTISRLEDIPVNEENTSLIKTMQANTWTKIIESEDGLYWVHALNEDDIVIREVT